MFCVEFNQAKIGEGDFARMWNVLDHDFPNQFSANKINSPLEVDDCCSLKKDFWLDF